MVDDGAHAGVTASALGTAWCPGTALAAAEHLLGAVEPKSGTLLLDLVAGLGHCAGLATRRGVIATGIDSCAQRLDTARRRYPQALFYTGEPDSLVFADAFFSTVTHHAGPGQAPSPTALAEAYRVLMPGGRHAALCLGAPVFPQTLGGEQGKQSDDHQDPGAALRACWQAAGFDQVQVTEAHIDWQPADTLGQPMATLSSAGRPPVFAKGRPPGLRWTAVLVSASKPG